MELLAQAWQDRRSGWVVILSEHGTGLKIDAAAKLFRTLASLKYQIELRQDDIRLSFIHQGEAKGLPSIMMPMPEGVFIDFRLKITQIFQKQGINVIWFSPVIYVITNPKVVAFSAARGHYLSQFRVNDVLLVLHFFFHLIQFFKIYFLNISSKYYLNL